MGLTTMDYPIYDRLKLAELPDGWYEVRGPEHRDYIPSAVYKRGSEWFDGNGAHISGVGGIGARLADSAPLEALLRRWLTTTHYETPEDLIRESMSVIRRGEEQ